jgi:hypothetical protein
MYSQFQRYHLETILFLLVLIIALILIYLVINNKISLKYQY